MPRSNKSWIDVKIYSCSSECSIELSGVVDGKGSFEYRIRDTDLSVALKKANEIRPFGESLDELFLGEGADGDGKVAGGASDSSQPPNCS